MEQVYKRLKSDSIGTCRALELLKRQGIAYSIICQNGKFCVSFEQSIVSLNDDMDFKGVYTIIHEGSWKETLKEALLFALKSP